MKLITYVKDNKQFVGALRGEGIVNLTAAGVANSVLELIAAGESALERAKATVVAAKTTVSRDSVKVLAPIPEPRRDIFCVGKNYREHAVEFGTSGFDSAPKGNSDVPEHPIIFTKATTSVSADGDPILSELDPDNSLDYEGELAVVIGKGGRGIKKARAFEHVFGYTVLNDVTARVAQKRHQQWVIAKGPDTFCPMGPALVTADEVSDVTALRVQTFVNKEMRQNAPVSDLIFDIPTIIETLSASMTLLPGDIIATGTPAGVAIGFKPPKYLVRGDTVTVIIQGVGMISNPVA